MVRAPSMQELSKQLAHAATSIAQRISRTGHRLWIVGGAARDLALGREPKDVDVASAATPDEIEAAFEHTIPVGKAFGTIVIRIEGVDVQHTTFRGEHGHSDARRPDRVGFGSTVEEDASRRDFTCNAIYLDPLDDRCLDPEHGLDDLEAGTLRTVGEPRLRFAEDGLRLLRMARFAAALDLELAPGLAQAARESGEALRGVSPERELVELSTMMERPGHARAITILEGCGLLERVLPGWTSRVPDALTRREWALLRLRALGALASPPGTALGLAALLVPTSVVCGGGGGADLEPALALADGLRVSRALRRRLAETWEIAGRLAPAQRSVLGVRSERIRLLRHPGFTAGAELALAWRAANGLLPEPIAGLIAERSSLGEDELFPEAWISSADLDAARLPRGPLWGEILDEAERLQLDRAWRTRDEALAWLAVRLQEGGNTPRKA